MTAGSSTGRGSDGDAGLHPAPQLHVGRGGLGRGLVGEADIQTWLRDEQISCEDFH